jgi:hypothetical protein
LKPQPVIRTELNTPSPPFPHTIAARFRHCLGTLTVTRSEPDRMTTPAFRQ